MHHAGCLLRYTPLYQSLHPPPLFFLLLPSSASSRPPALSAQFPRYRSQDALTDATLRSLVRNWAPEVDRTPNGFYRGVSLRPRVNEFTGELGEPSYGTPFGGRSVQRAAA